MTPWVAPWGLSEETLYGELRLGQVGHLLRISRVAHPRIVRSATLSTLKRDPLLVFGFSCSLFMSPFLQCRHRVAAATIERVLVLAAGLDLNP